MKVTLSDALDFVGIDVGNARKNLKGARQRALDWLDETNAPKSVTDFMKRFVRLGTNIDIDLTNLAILVGAALYIICPIDLIPDFLPILGWTDDAAVAAAALAAIETATEEIN